MDSLIFADHKDLTSSPSRFFTRINNKSRKNLAVLDIYVNFGGCVRFKNWIPLFTTRTDDSHAVPYTTYQIYSLN
jgi:hypothetical protein